MLDHTSPQILKGMYINGQWVTPEAGFNDLNPSDGTIWAKAPDGGASEARSAIDAAQAAFPAWSSLSVPGGGSHVLSKHRGNPSF